MIWTNKKYVSVLLTIIVAGCEKEIEMDYRTVNRR